MTDELPLPDYDQLPLGDLRHRVRTLDEAGVRSLIEHEEAHGNRVPVLEVLRSRLTGLAEGATPSGGDPARTPGVSGTAGGSPVEPKTGREPNTPLRHGVAGQTPARGRPGTAS
jgi:hypothetical protein